MPSRSLSPENQEFTQAAVLTAAEACLIMLSNAHALLSRASQEINDLKGQQENLNLRARYDAAAADLEVLIETAFIQTVVPQVKRNQDNFRPLPGEDPGLAIQYAIDRDTFGWLMFYGGLVAQPGFEDLGIVPATPDQVSKIETQTARITFNKTSERFPNLSVRALANKNSVTIGDLYLRGKDAHESKTPTTMRSYVDRSTRELVPAMVEEKAAFKRSSQAFQTAAVQLAQVLAMRLR